MSPPGDILLPSATDDRVHRFTFRKLPALQELGSGEAGAGWGLDSGVAVCAVKPDAAETVCTAEVGPL